MTLGIGGARSHARRSEPKVVRRVAADGAPVDTILVVEDHPGVRFAIVQQLIDAGYATIEVTSGEEALALLDGSTVVDALVTDLRLPGTTDGWDIAERARELRPDLPVVYVSAYSYVSPRQVPGSIMLNKPHRPEELLEALGQLLD